MSSEFSGNATGEKTPAREPQALRAFDTSDPGDETQLNFRYQHLYGVILLVAAYSSIKPYTAVWCEHFEDFLCDRSDGLVDAYQIKTQRPERGPWRTSTDAFVKSIGRFVDLRSRLNGKSGTFCFVSNTECDHVADDIKDQRKRGRCPKLFLAHVAKCASSADVSEPFLTPFQELSAQCGCSEADLFATLQQIEIVLGPSRREVDASVSNEHLGSLSIYASEPTASLNKIRDDIAAIVHRASSLYVVDPARHLIGTVRGATIDSRVAGKRLIPDEILVAPDQMVARPAFTYVEPTKLELGKERSPTVLVQKLSRGGLEDQIEYMQVKERAAEYALMTDIMRRPERYPALQSQVENVVLGVCAEATLRHASESKPFGRDMLISVQDALRNVATNESGSVGNHSYECLIGVVGLFTSACRVWWSKRFQVDTGETL